jgi:DNA-binding transcriptional LysR family regulator
MNITFRQLRVFIAVTEHCSFSRAAETMHITQPAVSRYVRELEDALQLRLFDRTTREVVPTDAARALHRSMTQLLKQFEANLLDITSEHARHSGKVRVASAPTLSSSLMPTCVQLCTARYPEINLQMLDQVQSRGMALIRNGEVDFGLMIDPQDDNDLHIETVMEDPFYLACRHDHPLAEREGLEWAELATEALVLLDDTSGSRRLINQEFARCGIAPRVTQEVGHPTTVFRLIDAGVGVSVLPGLAWPAPQASRVIRQELIPLVRRRVCLVRRAERSLSPAAQVVWTLMMQELSDPAGIILTESPGAAAA